MSVYAFKSPSRYVQGERVLDTLGKEVEILGSKAFIISDEVVWNILSEKVENSFTNSKADFVYEIFHGESSVKEIERLAEVANAKNGDVVVALGGGKAIDTAKALADEIHTPVVIAPTIASTDAPASALSVIYSEDGTFESYRFFHKNPDLVLVDTEVVVNAPAHLFASGMADALATCVEASATLQSNGNNMAGGKSTMTAQAIARACEEILFTEGVQAFAAVKEKVITTAVDHIVEANTLMSGIGFENGGLAGAHAVHNGFTALSGEIHDLTHGAKVAYGTLVQLVLENRPLEEIGKFINFYQAIGMPTTLKEMKLDNTDYSDLLKVGELANDSGDTMGNLSRAVSAKNIADAIIAVDAISNNIV